MLARLRSPARGSRDPQEADGDDGGFPPSDVHVVRLMAAFEEAGIALEDVARGVSGGALSFPLGMFMPDPVGMTETYAGLAARVGRSTDLLRRLSRELGLAAALRRPGPRGRRGDPVAHRHAARSRRRRGALALRQALRRQRAATGRLRSPVLRSRGPPAGQGLSSSRTRRGTPSSIRRRAGYTELVRTLVPWLQTRHREHAVLEYIVGVTEGFMEERGITPPQQRQPPRSRSSTSPGTRRWPKTRGDQAAAPWRRISRASCRRRRRHTGKPVKWLGDGVMFHFADPGRAYPQRPRPRRADREGESRSRPDRDQRRRGDRPRRATTSGGRCNIAARIADYARPHGVLVSEEAREAPA